MAAALDFVNRSIDSNALNIRAQNLKAAVLRHLGRPKEALQVLAAARTRPIRSTCAAMAETWLASEGPGSARKSWPPP